MATATAPKPAPAPTAAPTALIAPERLPYHPLIQERFGVDRSGWRALVDAIFPSAQTTDSVVLALAYCKARNLDPFKRCVHIVPIYDRKRECMVDTIWPGIGELRTTAFRTGQYAGIDEMCWGPDVTMRVGTVEMVFPEWAQVTVYRICGGQRMAFSGARVYWMETYAQVKRTDATPNEMWHSRPRGQLAKCAESAALRAAFPEEIGNELISDEVSDRSLVFHGRAGVPRPPQDPELTKSERLEQVLAQSRDVPGSLRPVDSSSNATPSAPVASPQPTPSPPTAPKSEAPPMPPEGTVSWWLWRLPQCKDKPAVMRLYETWDGVRGDKSEDDQEAVESAFASRLAVVLPPQPLETKTGDPTQCPPT